MPGPFTFPQDSNYKAGAIKNFRDNKDFVIPTADVSGMPFLLANSVLGANAIYIQPTQDRLGNVLLNRVQAFVFADQGGTLYIEEANVDGAWSVSRTINLDANQLSDSGWVWLTKKLYRFRYVNGVSEQGVFALYQMVSFGQIDVQQLVYDQDTGVFVPPHMATNPKGLPADVTDRPARVLGKVDAVLLGSTGGQVTVTDGKLDVNAQVTVSAVTTGSDMELYGKTLDDRPAANTMKAGTTFTIVDAILDQNWISDGTDWLEV